MDKVPMKIKFINPFIRCLALIGILTVALAGCAYTPAAITPTIAAPAAVKPSATPSPTATPGAYWPTDDWRTSTPEEQGMDGAKLAQMLDGIQQQHLGLHSLLIIRHGYIVSETYYGPYQRDTRHELYSCTKSFMSTLIGIAVDQGKIKGTSQRVMDFFPGRTFANPDLRKESMTVDDLLTMRSGLDWIESDQTYTAMYWSKDWAKYVLDEPMAQSPGSQFNYCSGCSHVLSAILQQATGMETREFATRYLFEPLGISSVTWDVDSSALAIGGWGLQITPRQMAKLGYLYLHDGKWDGQQIVSAEWVKTATQKHTEIGGEGGYGYQWWIYPSLGAYTALGRYGQMIFVAPASNLVVVMTAQIDNHDPEFKLIEDYILPAVQNANAPD